MSTIQQSEANGYCISASYHGNQLGRFNFSPLSAGKCHSWKCHSRLSPWCLENQLTSLRLRLLIKFCSITALGSNGEDGIKKTLQASLAGPLSDAFPPLFDSQREFAARFF